MKREDFLKKGILGTGILAFGIKGISLLANDNDELSKLDPISHSKDLGFNHLPHTDSKIMENTVIHKSDTRGDANHGWLHSKHTFSFANYYNPERMHFGVLRVLNDDIVAGGKGFGAHPHDNMEIISIPLEGDLEHKDSMGNATVIKNGDIQVMSAGTGIQHSEYNKNQDLSVKFLQIWMFPNKRNVQPRYGQISLKKEDRKNTIQQILSPNEDDAGVWVHQNAWFHLADFDKEIKQTYQIKREGNGLYVFVLKGELTVNGEKLSTRDGFGIWDVKDVQLEANSNAEFLLMDVPMAIE